MIKINLENLELYREVVEPVVEEISGNYGFEIKVRAYDLTPTLDDPGNEMLTMFIFSSGDIDSDNDIALNDWDNFIFDQAEREWFRDLLQQQLDRSGIGHADYSVEILTPFATDHSMVTMILEVR